MFALDLPFCPVEFLQLLCSSHKKGKQKPNTTPDTNQQQNKTKQTTTAKLLKRRGFCKPCRIELGCYVLSALGWQCSKKKGMGCSWNVAQQYCWTPQVWEYPPEKCFQGSGSQRLAYPEINLLLGEKKERLYAKYILQCFFSPVALTFVWVYVRGILVLDP